MPLHLIPVWLIPFSHALVALVFLRRFLSEPVVGKPGRSLFPLAIGAVVMHGLCLICIGVTRGRLPFGTMAEAISFGALVLGAAWLIIQTLARTESLGVFFQAVLAIATTVSASIQEPPRWPIHLQSALFATHASVGSAALALLVASSLLGGLYLLQYRQLSQRNFGFLASRLPDLMTLDRLFLVTLAVGTLLLGLAAIAGAVWIYTWNIPVHAAGFKSLLVIGAFVYNAMIPLLRSRNSFTSRTSARLGLGSIGWVILVVLAGSHVF